MEEVLERYMAMQPALGACLESGHNRHLTFQRFHITSDGQGVNVLLDDLPQCTDALVRLYVTNFEKRERKAR